MDYKILSAANTPDLEKLVAQALKDGYMLAGGVCVCVPLSKPLELLQAVYKLG